MTATIEQRSGSRRTAQSNFYNLDKGQSFGLQYEDLLFSYENTALRNLQGVNHSLLSSLPNLGPIRRNKVLGNRVNEKTFI
jgi:hypothetical protein